MWLMGSNMARFRTFTFAGLMLVLSWYGMMAVHELGHVVGAMSTGGTLQRVVLHPMSISRTDVSPNPHPAWVVWLGPVLGCLMPLAVTCFTSGCETTIRKSAQFFAGFCLIANGAYIAIGSFDQVGDCGELLRTGAPQAILIAFGAITIPLGFALWHKLGSPSQLWKNPTVVTTQMLRLSIIAVIVATIAGATLSSR